MKKSIITLILVIALLISSTSVYAADITKSSADALHSLGLFNGSGVNADGTPQYNLENNLSRAEMVTMMVKLLGKEEEARNGDWKHPFTDVPDWASPYIGYAWANGLVGGSSPTTFSSNDQASETQYLTLILRSLGYEDSKGDFSWDKARVLSDKIGVTSPDNKSTSFTRGSLAEISLSALATPMKNSSEKFADKLIKQNVFKAETFNKALNTFKKEKDEFLSSLMTAPVAGSIVDVEQFKDVQKQDESSKQETKEEIKQEVKQETKQETKKESTTNSKGISVPKSNDVKGEVWVPVNGGTKYHSKSSCSNMKNPKCITLEHAKAAGYTACKKCY